MVNQYRDNYPHNVEAPQRVYVQYSQDITFDYSTGKYPLGEEHEGFIWENTYIPVEHTYGGIVLGRHVWMRWRVGERSDWTLPMRFTDSFINIEATELEEIIGTEQVQFRFKYTLNSGEIVYSEYMVLTNGIDGRGITLSEIVGNDLHLTYSDNTIENLGRVVGYNGTGVPIGTTDYFYLVSIGDVPQWRDPLFLLNDNLSGITPIDYTNGVISHILTDGNRHIPVGGSSGDSLITDGIGNYSWDTHILLSDLDDTAGAGDTDKIFSADRITNLLAGSAFGIKYSVLLYSDLALISPTPSVGELAVVTADPLYPNRPVYQYDGTTPWLHFFDLDATHNHDTLYTRSLDLTTPNTGSLVHYTNIFGAAFFTDWTASADSGSVNIANGDILNIVGAGSISTSITSNVLTITGIDGTYIDGEGLDLVGNVFSHSDTSSVANTTNHSTSGYMIWNLEFDTFGHVTDVSSRNLDTRYSLLAHTHATLENGIGLTGSNYNGSTGSIWAVDFAGNGSANTVSRSDHIHGNYENSYIVGTTTNMIIGNTNASSIRAIYLTDINKYMVTLHVNSYRNSSFATTHLMNVIYIPASSVALRPDIAMSIPCTFGWNGTIISAQLVIQTSGLVQLFIPNAPIADAWVSIVGTVTYIT